MFWGVWGGRGIARVVLWLSQIWVTVHKRCLVVGRRSNTTKPSRPRSKGRLRLGVRLE